MNVLGRHLLLELKGCDVEVLNDLSFLKGSLVMAAEESGAEVLGECFHQFNPHGVSGTVIISESHLFIHTWPEHCFAAADIFTCGDSVQTEKAAQILVEKLGAKSHSMIEIERGVIDNNE